MIAQVLAGNFCFRNLVLVLVFASMVVDFSANVCFLLAAADHFAVLGLPVERVEAKAVRTAYRAAALLVHPDKNPDDYENAKQAFVVLSTAFECLSGSLVCCISCVLIDNVAQMSQNRRFTSKNSRENAQPQARTRALSPVEQRRKGAQNRRAKSGTTNRGWKSRRKFSGKRKSLRGSSKKSASSIRRAKNAKQQNAPNATSASKRA